VPRSTPDTKGEGSGTAAYLSRRLADMHVYGEAGQEAPPFRLAPRPVALPAELSGRLQEIGEDLAAFQDALQHLYRQSEKDASLSFVRTYLDRGKPQQVVEHARLNRLKKDLPILIRPDILDTEDGIKVAEVDAVPGGWGTLAALQEVYADLGFDPGGGPTGVVDAFGAAIAALTGNPGARVAIAVSDEASDYLPEMEALGRAARSRGLDVSVLHPRQIRFSDEGLFLPEGGRVDVLYRFFELFDIKNVPKWEIFLYAAKHRTVTLTPPAKPYLEEKLQAAFLFHDSLAPLWQDRLGPNRLERLRALFPRTWVVDGGELPPQARISGLTIGNVPVRSFRELKGLSQSERQNWLLKPSGFSPLAWGAHGVRVGADLSAADWEEAVDRSLAAWEAGDSPWVLQAYHKPKVGRAEILEGDRARPFECRGRYCPYYFRTGEGMTLGGVLVTLCPKDKKIIHGMSDAVMAPGSGF